MDKMQKRNTDNINIVIISDYPKLKSFNSINNLLLSLNNNNAKVTTIFYDIFANEDINTIKNKININHDCIIISLTKGNLMNVIKSNIINDIFNINEKITVFIFGSINVWGNLKPKYKDKVYFYERKGVSKTSKILIEDIDNYIAQFKKLD